MTPRRFVFNPPMAALSSDSDTTCYLASNAPSLILEELPELEPQGRRHKAQRSALRGRALPDDADARCALFGDDLTRAYYAYKVRRLWVDDAHEHEEPGQAWAPLGDAPPRALPADQLAARRLEALLGGRAQGEADETLYLFNVIVALEWLPSPARLRRLQWAFRRASDYLYDVTNGAMAFGQVIFADSSWMLSADIQILASNRYLPRSWVGGLFEPHKYTPIRLGRGLWVRDRRIVIDWDEPEGYRAIVHEWVHYALGMKDEYMTMREVYDAAGGRLVERPPAPGAPARRVVLPERRAKSESIMASPQGNSELGKPLPIGENMQRVIDARYPGLRARLEADWSGPGQLPLPLPHFRLAGALAEKGYRHNERTCAIPCAPQTLLGERAHDSVPFVPLDHDTIPTGRWEVFLLSYDAQGQLRRISAQGEVDARTPEHGFTLLGAAEGDTVALIDSGSPQPSVWTRTLGDDALVARQRGLLARRRRAAGDKVDLERLVSVFKDAGWRKQSGPDGAGTLAVIPLTPEDGRKNAALVRLSPAPQEVAVFGVDGQRHDPAANDKLTFALPSLDGYVVSVARQRQGPGHARGALAISDFSQGGPPASAPNLVSDPIAAGAASGEALICCHVTDETVDASEYRVVTTTSRGVALGGGFEALSPLYTIASNKPLLESFTPTLLIVNAHPDAADSERIRVCVLDDGDTPRPLATYVAPGGVYGAAPLTATSVPALIAAASAPGAAPEGEVKARFVLARVPSA